MQPLIITALSNELLLTQARILPAKGCIQQQDDYCYLKIDDEYIHSLFPLLQPCDHKINKPPYFEPPKEAGAHISVIYPTEYTPLKPEYAHQQHYFSISGLIKAGLGIKNYFALAVNAPTLTDLRIAHQLAAKPLFKAQPIVFHITIGMSINQ